MTPPGNPQKLRGCPFCDKKGLPILPLRYALARNDIGKRTQAPRLGGPFGKGVQDIALPDGQHYTLRLLRPGYLYVFNEKRGAWDAYVVTDKGYLYPYVTELKHDVLKAMDPDRPQHIDGYLQPPTDDIEFSCRREPDHPHLARCIMVPNADAAAQLWIAFSDTAWTKRVWREHTKSAVRAKHMRKLRLDAWRGGGAVEHADELAKLGTLVSESLFTWVDAPPSPGPLAPKPQPPTSPWMSPSWTPESTPEPADTQANVVTLDPIIVTAQPRAFAHSAQHVYGMQEQVPGLVSWAQAQAKRLGMRPMLAAIDDPVGITMEIAGMMNLRLEEFMQRPDLQRPLAISSLLGSLEEAIRNQAELNLVKARQDQAARELEHWRDIPFYGGGEGIPDPNRIRMETEHYRRLRDDPAYAREWEQKTTAAKQAAADKLTAADLDEAAEDAWKKYRKKLRQNEPVAWKKGTYEPTLKKYDQQWLVPLARVHKAWMHSEVMRHCFECNHDDQDAESGQGYVDTLLLCIQDTQQNQLCFDDYQEWLQAKTIGQDNLLLRALAYNQKEVLDALNQVAASGELRFPTSKWKDLIKLYDRSLAQLSEGGQNAVARVVTALGGPIMKVLDGALDKGVGPAMIALGMIARTPIVHVQHVGYISEALDVMVESLKQANPALAEVDAGLLKRRLEIQTRGGNRQMTPAGKGKWNIELRVNRLALEAISEDLPEGQAAKRAAKSVMSFKEWNASASTNWKSLVSTKLRLGVVQGILHVFATYKLAEALDKSMSHQRQENTWRYRAGVAGIIGAAGGVLDEGLQNLAKAYGGRLSRVASSWVGWALRLTGRAFGFVAAGIMAVCDGWRAYTEVSEGNYGIAALYAISAVAGMGAALMFTGWLGATVLGLSATGVGVILVVIAIAVALLIEFLKDNKLQDWLERCHFGKFDEEDRYPNLDDELAQFELAIKPG